jgi:TolA-binding protein
VAFAEGYEKYPKNVKAPDNLLKLGMSLGNLGQKDNACRAYSRLDRDYPQAPSEVKDRATAEKKRLGCTG